jgi:hypothetical protein
MSCCFCVDGEIDEDDEEQFDSVVFERDKVVESFISLLITTAIVCIAESVSLSTFCGIVILFWNHVFAGGVFGLTGGGVDKDLRDLS